MMNDNFIHRISDTALVAAMTEADVKICKAALDTLIARMSVIQLEDDNELAVVLQLIATRDKLGAMLKAAEDDATEEEEQ